MKKDTRKHLYIGAPDNDTLIFVDQVASLIKNGSGCIVRTSDGVSFTFNHVTFEDMAAKLTTWPDA